MVDFRHGIRSFSKPFDQTYYYILLNAIKYLVQSRDAHTRTVVLAPYFRTFRTEYKEYGVRRPSYLESTDFSTGYGHFF